MSKYSNVPLSLTEAIPPLRWMLPIRPSQTTPENPDQGISGTRLGSSPVLTTTTRERLAAVIQEVLDLVDESDFEDDDGSGCDKNE